MLQRLICVKSFRLVPFCILAIFGQDLPTGSLEPKKESAQSSTNKRVRKWDLYLPAFMGE